MSSLMDKYISLQWSKGLSTVGQSLSIAWWDDESCNHRLAGESTAALLQANKERKGERE